MSNESSHQLLHALAWALSTLVGQPEVLDGPLEYVSGMSDESSMNEFQPLNKILADETEMSDESPENKSEGLEEPLEGDSEPSME